MSLDAVQSNNVANLSLVSITITPHIIIIMSESFDGKYIHIVKSWISMHSYNTCEQEQEYNLGKNNNENLNMN